MKSGLQILGCYVKDRIVFLVYVLLLQGIVWLVHNLNEVSFSIDFYIMLLSGWLVLVMAGIDFIRYYKKAIRAQSISVMGEEGITQFQEEKLTYIEHSLCETIQKELHEKNELVSKQDTKQQELLDYYTMWVHQIKTPLAALHLLMDNEDFPAKKDVQTELFRTEQYVEIALQSLRIFHSESTDYVLQEQPLENIVRQAVRKYAKMFITKHIRMEFKEFHYMVLTDEKWLQFVIEQLLSNAIKYTKTGSVTIWADDTDGLALYIKDTGIGISAEDLPRVFDKGFTGYNGRKDKKSTGIGLYICKEILHKLTHEISIDSTLGEGTTVKIMLEKAAVDIKYE